MIGVGMLGMTLGGWSVSAAAWAFEVSIKAAIVVGIALFLCAVLRRAAAAVRAGVLAAALLSLLVLPLLPMLLPGWSFPRLSGPPRFSEVVMETGSEWADSGDQSEPLSLVSEPVVSEAADDGSRGEAARETGRGLGRSMEGPVLGGIFWAMGAGIWLVRMVWGHWRVARMLRHGQSMEAERSAALLAKSGAADPSLQRVRLVVMGPGSIPAAWGVFRPVIMLPREWVEWPEERTAVILVHELAHVRRWDCLIQAMVDVAVGLFWFLPHVWWAWGRLRQERERACDEQVLLAGYAPYRYAQHLMEVIAMMRKREPELGVTMALSNGVRTLEGRLRNILNGSGMRVRPRLRIGLTAGLAAMVLGVATWHPWVMADEALIDSESVEVEFFNSVETDWEDESTRVSEVEVERSVDGRRTTFRLEGDAAIAMRPVRMVWMSPGAVLRLEERSELGTRILEFSADEEGIPTGRMVVDGSERAVSEVDLRWLIDGLRAIGQIPKADQPRGLYVLPRSVPEGRARPEARIRSARREGGTARREGGTQDGHRLRDGDADGDSAPAEESDLKIRGEIRIEGDPPRLSMDWDGAPEDLSLLMEHQKELLQKSLRGQSEELKAWTERLQKDGLDWKDRISHKLLQPGAEGMAELLEEQGRMLERFWAGQEGRLEAMEEEIEDLSEHLRSRLDREAAEAAELFRRALERQEEALRRLLASEEDGPDVQEEQPEGEPGS